MSYKIILYPIIKKSDFLYTEYDFCPNDITLINNIIITPLLLYFLYNNKFKLSFLFLYLRAVLDGVDGYIARKYKKYSKLGEIYDHVSDAIYSGFITLYCLEKISKNKGINNSISYIISIIIMMINFDKRLKFIGENIMGAGGSENTYSTLINLIPLIFVNKNFQNTNIRNNIKSYIFNNNIKIKKILLK